MYAEGLIKRCTDLDSRLAYPRPRPRLSSLFQDQDQDQDFDVQDQDRETQDLQDQYWKSMTGMDCDKQKD